MKLKTLALSAPLRLVWTLALYIGVNVAVLDWLGIGRTVGGWAFVVRNAAVALGVFWVSVRLLEGKRLREAGLDPRRAPPELAAGFGLGAAVVSAIVGMLAGVGAYRIQGLWPLDHGSSRAGWFALTVLGLFLVGFAEEVRNRGILFRLLEQNLGTWVALGLSALAFGFAHWKNPGATWWSSLAITLEGGVLLAALYAATRSLWLPIGVHWAWNLFEGPIFGAAISGNSVGALARGELSGPAWLTGGAFGPEAGIPALVVGGAAGILAVVWMVQRGEVRPPPWVRAQREPEAPLSEPAGPPTDTPSGTRTGTGLPRS
ncbi:MAG TPA: type II CAAX endopeptidase family protein [Myxococcaceae bacterium]|nr:type II CAAX endopeptidase family protein [Myxococcaceae bacterium]